MRHLIVLAGLAVGLLGSVTDAPADCRARVVVRQNAVVVKEKVVVEPAVIATFAPLVVAVPQYSVGYAAPAYAPPPATPTPPAAAASDETAKLRAEIASLRAEMARLKTGSPAPAEVGAKAAPSAPKAEDRPFVAVLQSKCASCHEARVANAKGGKLVLLNGIEPAALTPAQLLQVVRKTWDGDMPPREKLSDEDQSALMTWLHK